MTVAHAVDPRGPVPAILERLDKVKHHTGENGVYWTARCPAHHDRNPSLSISEGSDGRALIKCHAGCHYEDILTAINLTEDDLFPERPVNGALLQTAAYTYTDELGNHLYDVVRFEPKTFRQRRPDGTWGLGDTRRVLYRLPDIAGAIANGEPVYLVEGEKDADAIANTGATATTNPMGAGKWRDDYSLQLANATQVVIVADNDDPGREHATAVARSLEQHNIPHRVTVPGAGKDATDHLAAGLTLDELVPLITTSPIPGVVKVVTLDEFVSVTEDVADPLIGTPDDSLLPADGLLLMYGDGGAGKTTLSIDAMAHLASGTEWLGLTVPKPLTVLLIENEGPRGPFRQRLAHKIADWENELFSPRVVVLEEPWTRFTITEPSFRSDLAAEINQHDVDLVIVGPLASLGAKGTGTPDEINEFDNHIKDLRGQVDRRFALWIVHHENKQGDVSGAWERYPDTLVHVQAQGNGRTRVYWRKVRWSSTLHGTSTNLVWAAGNSFETEETQDRDYRRDLIDAFTRDNQWRTISEAKTLIQAGQDHTKNALSALVDEGRFLYQKGPEGRRGNAVCWKLKTDPDAPGNHGSVTQLDGFERSTDPLTPTLKESEGGSDESEPREETQPDPGETSKSFTDDPELMAAIYDDDIPF